MVLPRRQGEGRRRHHQARPPPRELAETLAAYERGEINVLINAMLLAEGWNSPRATVCMHLAPTASKRVYQQRIGRIMRTHPRKEAGIVVDFVPKGATHNERVVSLHSLLDADFYREGARVTPAPRRRVQRRARAHQRGQRVGQGEDEVEIRRRQQLGLACVKTAFEHVQGGDV